MIGTIAGAVVVSGTWEDRVLMIGTIAGAIVVSNTGEDRVLERGRIAIGGEGWELGSNLESMEVRMKWRCS